MADHERWFAMQAIFTAVWILFCLKVAHESMVLMNVSTRDKFFLEVYLYYNPVFLMALMVWLWGVNVYVFLNARIPYAKVFELEHIHLTHHEIWKVVIQQSESSLQHLIEARQKKNRSKK
jgi:hypothetical protein